MTTSYTGKSSDLVLGVNVLKDIYTGKSAFTFQYADDAHDAVMNAEVLEAGAIGEYQEFVVYNPTDTPIAFENCTLISYKQDVHRSSRGMFSNGISFGYVDAGDPAEAVTAILGDPYDMYYTDKPDELKYYIWRDETRDHVLQMTVEEGKDGTYHAGVSYVDFSLVHPLQ